MTKLAHWAGLVGGASVLAAVGVTLLVECADPREDEQVSVVTSCAPDAGVFERLSTDPSSPQASVVEYVNASEALAAKVSEMNNLLRDGCNDVDTELGLPTGADPQTACQPIASRAATVTANQPPAGGGPTPAPWFNVTFPTMCSVDPNARAACLQKCSVSDAGPCDNTHCTPATTLSGTCQGNCLGTCTVTGQADAGVACTGACQGTCTELTADGGPLTVSCTGECNGQCAGAPTYNGFCATGCGVPTNSSNLFTGECDGTCTGTCNGTPINGGIPDGGVGAEAGIPSNADGNCSGICNGWCSSSAYGACNANACKGASFKGGVCANCSNTCVSGIGAGCTGTCDGTCTSESGDAGSACSGVCAGGCSGTLTNTVCQGTLACGQNAECNNACEAAAGATVTCTAPPNIEVESVSDLPLYNALKTKGAKIGQALQMLAALRAGESFVDNRSLSDFAAVGATGEVVRACVARGQAAVQQASDGIKTALAADPTAAKQ